MDAFLELCDDAPSDPSLQLEACRIVVVHGDMHLNWDHIRKSLSQIYEEPPAFIEKPVLPKG